LGGHQNILGGLALASDLVALIIGIAHYPSLKGWNIEADRTVEDALAVTRALRDRGVPPEQIKLLISGARPRESEVDGVSIGKAETRDLQKFLREELGTPPFVGKRFFLFCSGHGVIATKVPQTLLFLPDSFEGLKRVFNCIALESVRGQLQGMAFEEQWFCVNACQTAQEWSVGPSDEISEVHTLTYKRSGPVRQVQFFAAEELTPAPVESARNDLLSNGFAAAVIDCLANDEWPPSAAGWHHRLSQRWPRLRSIGAQQLDLNVFKLLYGNIRTVDRTEQRALASGAIRRAMRWKEFLSRAADEANAGVVDWQTTIIDLYARTADRLDLLMNRLADEIFTEKLVPDGIQRIPKWPDRGMNREARIRQLTGDITLLLANDRSLSRPQDIVDVLVEIGQCAKVAYVEVQGPCTEADPPLVQAMLSYWKGIIEEAVKRGPVGPWLPLLVVGHIDPDTSELPVVDLKALYHPNEPVPPERQLGPVNGTHLRQWLNTIIPAERYPARSELEAVLARELGGRLLEEIPAVPMSKIVDLVTLRTVTR
jgi:hypothetical protein